MPPAGLIPGFEVRRLPGFGIEVEALVGGSGPPLLLLHGYPQTRVMWRSLASRLAERFTLVMPDLRGYGRSDKPAGDAAHERYSKRTMARDQIETMRALGFERFAVAGHDRGGRVAYRLALDHAESVTQLAVLDIVPTAEVWAGMTAERAHAMFHWPFLAQPAPLPETVIGADPDRFLMTLLTAWAGDGFVFRDESLADYAACFAQADCIHATCEDYRAGWGPDRSHDEADRGHRRIEQPLLVRWSERFAGAGADPLATWGRWAEDARGSGLGCGHFLAEEAPDEVAAALLDFFS